MLRIINRGKKELEKMMQGKGFHWFHVLSLSLLLVGFQGFVQGRLQPAASLIPDRNDTAAFARWFVSQNTWGVLSTLSSDLNGAPFGNVKSFSDGLPDKGTGIPYFYLTTRDPTARNALKDPRSSFTFSEYPMGTCKYDAMNPTCARITLTGKLVQLDGNSTEAEFAQTALFTKHPEMKVWPADHDFRFYKLELENIFFQNTGVKPLTVEEYLHPKK